MKSLHSYVLTLIILFASQPASGQSSWVANRMRTGENAFLIYFGEDAKSVQGQLQALMRNDEFVEMGLNFRLLEPISSDAKTVIQELRIDHTSTWVLADSKGFCLTQGDKLPTAEIILQSLESAGIRSPIKLLRNFLKRHPDHLDARSQLLSRLRKIAEMRTIELLEIDLKTINELQQQEDPEYYYRMASHWFFIDTASYGNKKLNDKDDLVAWAAYAQELDTLFKAGDWQLISLTESLDTPAEVCSQLMKTVYKRLLPQVKSALLESPYNTRLWLTYTWMSTCSDDKTPVQDIIESLLNAIQPPEEFYGFLIEEARRSNKWEYIADMLWKRRYGIIYQQYALVFYFTTSDEKLLDGHVEHYWRDLIEPLLESLIRTSRIDDAEFMISNLAVYPHFPNFTKQAADLAGKCNRPDLKNKWSKLQFQTTKDLLSNEVLEGLLSNYSESTIFLLNASDFKPQVDKIIKNSELSEYNLYCYSLMSDMSNLMLKREGWYGDEPRWAMLNNDKKVIASGLGLPSENDIFDALERLGIEKSTDVLRKRIRENINDFNARMRLTEVLRQKAIKKARVKINEIPSGELSHDDDSDIWGEYASNLRYLVHNYYSHIRPGYLLFGMEKREENEELYKYSPIMKALANELLPIISYSIFKQPTADDYWLLWMSLTDPTSTTQLKDLMNGIVLSPLNTWSDVNTWHLLNKYVINSNWQAIIDRIEPLWETTINTGKVDPKMLAYYYWSQTLPLIEAYINLGNNEKIQELTEIFKQSSNWEGGYKSDLEKLFENYGKKYRE